MSLAVIEPNFNKTGEKIQLKILESNKLNKINTFGYDWIVMAKNKDGVINANIEFYRSIYLCNKQDCLFMKGNTINKKHPEYKELEETWKEVKMNIIYPMGIKKKEDIGIELDNEDRLWYKHAIEIDISRPVDEEDKLVDEAVNIIVNNLSAYSIKRMSEENKQKE